ncbi:arylalkylamine N-acetyltransferase 1-like isoform X2 [Euwallacea fornicatus]|uniref:arylalkylamine N-acetyltransferase 1-like isoform X2 n=1 Tax=Euwallacea fornicatus TaxID=995702 RepID=UPI00338EB5E6
MALHMRRNVSSRPPIERFKFTRYESIDVEAMTPPITPTTPVSPMEYEIQEATPKDKEDILNFLRTFFFKDEPLNKYLDLINEDNPRCVDLEKFALKELSNGINLKAVHNGNIIGICLNAVLKRDYLQNSEDQQKITDEKFSKIVRMLDKVGLESNVFQRFPDCDKAVTVKILSVDGNYRGQGIAKELLNKTREIAKELGAGFVTVDCSSHFTALALKKLGFELHYTLKYADHRENGTPVFKPEYPHVACTVYVQKV